MGAMLNGRRVRVNGRVANDAGQLDSLARHLRPLTLSNLSDVTGRELS